MLYNFQDLAISILLRKNIEGFPMDFVYRVENWIYKHLARFNSNASTILDSKDEEFILALISKEFPQISVDKELLEQLIKMHNTYLLLKEELKKEKLNLDEIKNPSKSTANDSSIIGDNNTQIFVNRGDYVNGNKIRTYNYSYKGNSDKSMTNTIKENILRDLKDDKIIEAINALVQLGETAAPSIAHRSKVIKSNYEKLSSIIVDQQISLDEEATAVLKIKKSIRNTIDLVE